MLPNIIKKKGGCHINNTLNFIGFKDIDVDELEIDEGDFVINAYVKLSPIEIRCPYCKSSRIYIKEYKLKVINHKHFTGKKCYIHYKQRRYLCRDCNKSFYEKNPFIFDNNHLSKETILFLLDEFKTTQSFKSISLKTGISKNQIIRIFDEYVNEYRETMPEVLGIDEFHNKRTGNGKYACILINNTFDHPSIVDIIQDRTIDVLSYYFQYITYEERNKVRYFVSDMYDGYKNIHDTYFPNSIHVVDTFHFIKLITDALNTIRIRIMKKYSQESEEYYILKKYYFVLLISKKKFKKERVYYRSFKREINHYDLLDIVCNVDDDLRKAYLIKDWFVGGYAKYDYDSALEFLDTTISKLKDSSIDIYENVAKSFSKWKVQIRNSYHMINGQRITNARTEGFNNLVKVIKRVGYGYAVFDRFRNRVLYIQRNSEKYKLSSK